MGNCDSRENVGEVVAKGLQNVEWTIPRFSALPRTGEIFLMSPAFDLKGSQSGLNMLINSPGDECRLYLWRGNPSLVLVTSCTLGLKRTNGSQETIGTETIEGDTLGCEFLLNRTRGELEKGDCLSNGNLTITCHIEEVVKKKSTGASNFTSRSPERLPRNNQVQLRSSTGAFYTKTQPASSYLVEQQCPKADRRRMSRETQTEALDSVTDKDESNEAKGVTLLSKNMRDLLTTENNDYDLRIFVKGQEFRAHRCILKARCPVFAMMLKHESKGKNSGEVHIEDCDPDSFDEFLLFVYTGRVDNLTTSKAPSLYYAADKYDFMDLKEQCVQFMETHLSTASVCDVALLAAKHGEKELLRMATEFFAKNMKQILLTVEWQKFMVGNPTVANELLIKSSER